VKSAWKVGLGSQLALAALAVCFLALPGKAKDTHNGSTEAPVCTSYPEWSCEPGTASARELVSAKNLEKAATMAEGMDDPSCTSYPEWSCEPQTSSSGGGSRALAGRMNGERRSKRDVSGAIGVVDESFERRPY
jgi:hypothetical protein